ncbi:hypothetical protein [Roseateles sp. LKC17W]|uniref:Ankyrin repeat domain-containing protein n=1 Tax=Pelomonas margarita TaxID=3299031 RepID=A0ABW7FJG8_9BURK
MPFAFFRAAVLALALLGALPGAHADTPRTPRQLIEQLGLEIRQILEATPSTRTPDDAERAVAEQIGALIQADPHHLSLTENAGRGGTPLMLAASHGYVQVVRALLAAPGVKLTADVADAQGETAWIKASFAQPITLAACQPGTLTRERYVLMPPYVRRMAYLMNTQASAFIETLSALQDAGAEPREDEARRAWLARCPNATPALRESLAGQALMPALVNAAVAQQIAFAKATRETFGELTERPPKDMRFVPLERRARGAAQPSPLLQVHQLHCPRMPKPEMPPGIRWTGHVLFKATIATRAGIIEGADFDVLSSSGAQRGAATDFFRHMVLKALAGYQCVGDFIFEQTFEIKVS